MARDQTEEDAVPLPAEESSDFILVDTPSKIKTLFTIKILILGLIAVLIIYGFLFDKWALHSNA